MDSQEQIVDRMIQNGKAIIAEAIAAYNPIAIMATYSGGNDSVVATHFAMEHIKDCFVFHADTLVGLEPAKQHARDAATRLWKGLEIGKATSEGPPQRMRVKSERRGKQKLVPFDPAILASGRWTDGATAYEEYVLNFGFPGRNKPQHARMYQRLKERSINRMTRELRRTGDGTLSPRPVLLISGIRRDESAIRAGYKCAHKLGNFYDAWVNPFYWNTAAEFAMYRDEFGLPENPVKRTCGISGECCCGTFGSESERLAYQQVDPMFVDYLTRLEAKTESLGHPWGWGEPQPKWWRDERKGQGFLFEIADKQCGFQPMCVGCANGRR